MSLPKEGHLGVLPQGGAEMTACRGISQLEVHQLLISSLHVAYPIELNGCEEPIIASLSESLANGISLTRGKSLYLEIDIPQSMAEELDQKASPIGKSSTIIIASPHKTTPPKLEGEVSMTMEVRSLLSWAMLDTSSHGSGNLTPRRLNLVVVLAPPSHKPKELPKLVDTSSQVSTLDDVEMAEASLEGVPTTISPIAMTTRSRSITPIWELGMELHQNESETAESIKEARAICSHVTLDIEALCFSTVKEAKVAYVQTIKEAKATHACTIWEAETTCSVAIRDAETWGASQSKSLYRQHAKTIQDLEEQVIQEEGRSQTDFLSACQAALHASPAELKGMLVASYHIL